MPHVVIPHHFSKMGYTFTGSKKSSLNFRFFFSPVTVPSYKKKSLGRICELFRPHFSTLILQFSSCMFKSNLMAIQIFYGCILARGIRGQQRRSQLVSPSIPPPSSQPAEPSKPEREDCWFFLSAELSLRGIPQLLKCFYFKQRASKTESKNGTMLSNSNDDIRFLKCSETSCVEWFLLVCTTI